MAAGVHLEEMPDRDLGINRGRLDFLAAEQLPDVADIRPALVPVRRAGMPEHAAGSAFLQPCAGATHSVGPSGFARLPVFWVSLFWVCLFLFWSRLLSVASHAGEQRFHWDNEIVVRNQKFAAVSRRVR